MTIQDETQSRIICFAKPKDFSQILSFLWKGHNKTLRGQTIDKTVVKPNHEKSITWNGTLCHM